MRAVVKANSKNDHFEFVELPIPKVDENQLLVKMKAIGVGIHDGYFFPPNPAYPYVIGIEGSGVIQKIGANVSHYKMGDKIAFISSMQAKGGTWAEFSVIEEDSLIVKLPSNLSFEEAAAIPVAANTVLKAFHSLNLPKGGSLFVAGGSGALGTLAIQIAHARGYIVTASASLKNHTYMSSLGANYTVDYNDKNWNEVAKTFAHNGFDAALAIQPGTVLDCLPIVKNNGHIVAVSGDQVNSTRGITIHQIPYHIDVKTELDKLFEEIANKNIKIVIEKIFAFDEALMALSKTQTRHARGKIIIRTE